MLAAPFQMMMFLAYLLVRRFHLCGCGITTRLRCPLPSTARIPKITLSFDSENFARDTFPTAATCSQWGCSVVRISTSYPPDPPGEASQVSVVSFSRLRVIKRGFAGGAGAEASEARVAALRRATSAT